MLLNVAEIDVNSVNHQNRTALWLAADTGRIATMGALRCREDIDVNRADRDGVTPLMCTTDKGKVDRQALLLNDLHIDVNRQDQNGMTTLILAIKKKNPALHLAVQHRRLSYISALVAQGNEAVNALNKAGDSALHLAAHNGRTPMARRLLQTVDIDVDKTNHAGLTPAMCAL
ncbi:MAG: ankyrin repeat domain-containing protein [Sodalis sp. (in: enterobacteria)]|uniref:ankyrin repeat domain-containing protein n=1 Tax=Sodalis sp. (in: enterobacteria) TaxID=1898979 RepID=UPI003F3E4CBA